MKRGYHCEKEDVPQVEENSQSITAEMRGRCIGIDDHSVFGSDNRLEKVGNQGGVIQRRNGGAQESCMDVEVYHLSGVAKACVIRLVLA